MPGRLGFPGGKVVANETVSDAIGRKISSEIGLTVNPVGIVKIINILMPGSTIYYYVVLADYVEGIFGEIKVESDFLKWYSANDIKNLSKDEYTEYFNDDVLSELISGKSVIFPLDLIQTQDNRMGEPLAWMKRGSHQLK
jgi:ADP-ribose pyrophosphatase YjhB (NUDIX family)